jgi:prolyl-tRNA synthetase
VTPKIETREAVLAAAEKLAAEIRAQNFHGAPVEVEVDKREIGGGTKNWEWIKRGVPVRIELGPRDLAQGTVALSRRDQGVKEKQFLPAADVPAQIGELLDSIQENLFARALGLREEHTHDLDTREQFDAFFTPKNTARPEIHGGFARAHWCGSASCEAEIKDSLKVTIRCIPNGAPEEKGACIVCGQPSRRRVLWAKSY